MAYAATSKGYGRNAGRRWRGGDVAELRRLVNRDVPLRAISLKLGRPEPAIRAKAGEIGLRVGEDAPAQPRLPLKRAEPKRMPSSPAERGVRGRDGHQLELFQ